MPKDDESTPDPASVNILNHLVNRLTSEFGHIAKKDFSAWGDEAETKIERMDDGIGHLAQALRNAASALKSGDPKRIRLAALYMPPLEREGRYRQKKARDIALNNAENNRRRRGGLSRGEAQRATAEKQWIPWVTRFRTLLANGESKPRARQIVADEMIKAEFRLASTDAFPTNETLRKRLASEK